MYFNVCIPLFRPKQPYCVGTSTAIISIIKKITQIVKAITKTTQVMCLNVKPALFIPLYSPHLMSLHVKVCKPCVYKCLSMHYQPLFSFSTFYLTVSPWILITRVLAYQNHIYHTYFSSSLYHCVLQSNKSNRQGAKIYTSTPKMSKWTHLLSFEFGLEEDCLVIFMTFGNCSQAETAKPIIFRKITKFDCI